MLSSHQIMGFMFSSYKGCTGEHGENIKYMKLFKAKVSLVEAI